jgi:hypothetical protein
MVAVMGAVKLLALEPKRLKNGFFKFLSEKPSPKPFITANRTQTLFELGIYLGLIGGWLMALSLFFAMSSDSMVPTIMGFISLCLLITSIIFISLAWICRFFICH